MRFGTDGVRGVANTELTPELALRIGRAAARVLGGPRLLIGRDTRRSGTMLEAALAAGVCSEGIDVDLVGMMPTPAVASLSVADSVPAAMISASHNPFADNGIKLFAVGGRKLTDVTQARVEEELARLDGGEDGGRPSGSAVGQVRHVEGRSTERYESAVLGALEGRSLGGLSVVLDCAHGAASHIAADVFRRAGAEVDTIGDDPDGTNINDGFGSTDTSALRAAVVARGAAMGFAFDGDADRVIAVDAAGAEIDGDQLIALCAADLRERGRLRHDTVVVTVMSNLGFRRAMQDQGISVVETAVGDRYVLEALDAGGFSLGGEQSGHLVFRDLTTTGDGLLSALVVADLVGRSGLPLGELADRSMTRLPQVLRNVRVAHRPDDLMQRLERAVAAASADLGDDGRVLVRPSGTEPVVRVMVEAGTEAVAAEVAEQLAAAVLAAAGDPS